MLVSVERSETREHLDQKLRNHVHSSSISHKEIPEGVKLKMVDVFGCRGSKVAGDLEAVKCCARDFGKQKPACPMSFLCFNPEEEAFHPGLGAQQ